MNVTIIGAGNMGRGIAGRIAAGGHAVTIIDAAPGKADRLATELRAAPLRGAIRSSAVDRPVADPVVVLALPYAAARDYAAANRAALAGRIVIDITNPLNATYDGLATRPGVSAAEEFAALLPESRVVKAYNLNFAGPLSGVRGDAADVFVAGDDAAAKAIVLGLVRDGGQNAIDAGPLARAQQLEGLALLGITLQGPLNLGFQSQWKLVA